MYDRKREKISGETKVGGRERMNGPLGLSKAGLESRLTCPPSSPFSEVDSSLRFLSSSILAPPSSSGSGLRFFFFSTLTSSGSSRVRFFPGPIPISIICLISLRKNVE
ncbi:hypothetical protein HBI06_082560 [Parastagonospora nodorum]|nr:hypothetical protein HBI06_082560 [Parastagonospora nodorum]KAH4245227.1 hypothetical protein HBI05_065700 [Parastagonospora nodorum]